MARLDDLLPEFKDDISPYNIPSKTVSNISIGKKRRAWLIEDEKVDLKKVTEPFNKSFCNEDEPRDIDSSKGSINHVYKPNLCFSDLRSNPLLLFRYLFELAQKAGNDYQTPRVKIGDMMLSFSMSKDSARTALRFLLKQRFIERIEFQVGSMGWSRYQLNINICDELKRGLLKGSIKPFSTSETKKESNFIDPWEEIDFSSLESIGFNKKHLLQIKNKTTPEIVQESINHFAYGLSHNKKTQGYPNPLATFISVLKRGEFWIEHNYQSPQELAKKKLLEIKKAELERIKIIEEEIYQVAFDEWKQSLNQKEIESLAPDLRKRGDPIPPHAKLSSYFKENIWPNKKNSYLA